MDRDRLVVRLKKTIFIVGLLTVSVMCNQLLQLLLLEPFSGVDFDRFVIMSNSSRSELGDICAPIGDGRACLS